MSDSHIVEPDYGTADKTLKLYLLGIAQCIILTLIPFYVVMNHLYSRMTTFGIIAVCAIAQFIVQAIFFLRLNSKTIQSKMNVMTFIFCIIVLLVVVMGSIWIMGNMDYNMSI